MPPCELQLVILNRLPPLPAGPFWISYFKYLVNSCHMRLTYLWPRDKALLYKVICFFFYTHPDPKYILKEELQSIFITFHKMILSNQFLFTLVSFVQIFIRVKVNCRISLSTSFKAALRSKEARLKNTYGYSIFKIE